MFMIVLFFISLFFGETNHSDANYIEVKGDPFSIGKELGEHMKDVIIELYQKKREVYKDHLTKWEDMSDLAWKAIKNHCPNSALEIQGMGSVDGLDEMMIVMLNTEYELSMVIETMQDEIKNFYYESSAASKKCTSFASMRKGELISGQTNDESWTGMLQMKSMIIQKRNEESLIFTHHGILGYMGMNDVGLTVLDNYIDDGEYNVEEEFIPTTVAIREILSMESVFEITRFLQETPRGIPLNYLLSKPGEGIMNIELSPTNMSILYLPQVQTEGKIEDICHTNHILYSNAMMDNDYILDPTSKERYEKCREIMKKYRCQGLGIDVERGKELLSTPPIERDGRWFNVVSSASMVFDPQNLNMWMKFYGQEEFKRYTLNV